MRSEWDKHVLCKALKVLLLLLQLLPELQQLFLLTLTDSIILIGLLTSLESISAQLKRETVSIYPRTANERPGPEERTWLTLGRQSWAAHRCRQRPLHEQWW